MKKTLVAVGVVVGLAVLGFVLYDAETQTAQRRTEIAARDIAEREARIEKKRELARIEASAPAAATATSKASPVAKMSALEQMEIAFDGNPSQQRIQPVLDRAMRLYKLEITEENYHRAASTLVAIRKKNGPPEMEILDYMIRSHVPGVNMQFHQIAAISAVMLNSGDR